MIFGPISQVTHTTWQVAWRPHSGCDNVRAPPVINVGSKNGDDPFGTRVLLFQSRAFTGIRVHALLERSAQRVPPNASSSPLELPCDCVCSEGARRGTRRSIQLLRAVHTPWQGSAYAAGHRAHRGGVHMGRDGAVRPQGHSAHGAAPVNWPCTSAWYESS